MKNSIRHPRTTDGPNFEWSQESNLLAFHCFVSGASSDNREAVASKFGVKYTSFNNRIQHFKSLSPSSKATTCNPSEDVREIYKAHLSCTPEFSASEIQKFLKHEYVPEAPEEDLDFETAEVEQIENLNSTFLNYWEAQRKYQSFDMSLMPWNDFAKVVSTMNIKSRGMKIESRIISNNNLKKSVMSEEGDAWLASGAGVEIKTSFITPLKGSAVSLTGIRLWEEKVKHYLLIVVDISDLTREPRSYAMWVPKGKLDEMDREQRLTTPGMKKSAAVGNKNIAKGLCLNTEELAAWEQKFPLPSEFRL